MEYLVESADRAVRDLEALYEHIQAAESIAAARWYNGLEQVVYALNRSPGQCPAAPEGRRTHRHLRQLLYGKKPHVYRVIFAIDEAQKVVKVLTIRHGARDEARLEEPR